MSQKQAVSQIERYIRARQPLLAIQSHEEERVMRALSPMFKTRQFTVINWTYTAGVTGAAKIQPAATKDPAAAFAAILAHAAENTKQVYVMKDLHGFLGTAQRGHQPVLTRYLRDVSAAFEHSSNTMILLSPTLDVPADLKKGMPVVDWPLPDSDELAELLTEAENNTDLPVHLNGDRGLVIDGLRGMTAFEARNALAAAMVQHRELSEKIIPTLVKEKSQIIKQGGLLEFFDKTVTMNEVGGLGSLKKYAARKRRAMTPQARAAGLDAPRGVVLVGVPGTGKSLAAKAIAGGTMPLIRLDVGALMGGLVGQSEANARAALRQVEAVSPCVLWIDEIEKALGGGGGENDGGTRIRVFGTLLTWMQERTSETYVVATANNVSALAPELLSRFDDIFFVDLPSAAERAEIIGVHLKKRGQTPEDYDLTAVAQATWGFAGREIERVVSFAIEAAYCDGQPLTTDLMIAAAGGMKPISVTMAAQIDAIRAWVTTSDALLANEGLEPKPETAQGHRRLDVE